MNELAIKVIQDRIDTLKYSIDSFKARGLTHTEPCKQWVNNVKQYEQSIELLKNPKEFDFHDMVHAVNYGISYVDSGDKITPLQWVEQHRRQKESKNG